jgi:hypothetical protein
VLGHAVHTPNGHGYLTKVILSETVYRDSRVRMRTSGEDFICSMIDLWRYSNDGSVIPIESRAYHSRNDPLYQKYYTKRGPRPAVPFRIQFYDSDEQRKVFVDAVDPQPTKLTKKEGIRGLISRKDKRMDFHVARAIVERGLLIHGGLRDMVPRMLGF